MSTVKLLVALQGPLDARLLSTQDRMSAALKNLWKSDIPYDQLSVSQLCQTANVSRQTFYRRYDRIDEILCVDAVRLLNSVFQKMDQDSNITRHMAHHIVDTVMHHLDFFTEVTWSHAETAIVQTLTGGLLRAFAIQEITIKHKPLVAEMIARNLLGFGQTMQRYPQIPAAETEKIVQQVMPWLNY